MATRRYLVFRSCAARRFLCVRAVRDENHARKIAKQNGLRLERTAYAVPADEKF